MECNGIGHRAKRVASLKMPDTVTLHQAYVRQEAQGRGMRDYRWVCQTGGCYFFTVVTARRKPLFRSPDRVGLLRQASLKMPDTVTLHQAYVRQGTQGEGYE